jgi:cytoskeletal protein CcmA (bactofilin family)
MPAPPSPFLVAEETDYFESPAPPIAMTASKNILSSDVEITGSITFADDLIIDGRIVGDIYSGGRLVVGENGLIAGEINTRSVTVFGRIEGNITVQERCELKTNCMLTGDISAGTLAIEEGSTFLGRSAVGRR